MPLFRPNNFKFRQLSQWLHSAWAGLAIYSELTSLLLSVIMCLVHSLPMEPWCFLHSKMLLPQGCQIWVEMEIPAIPKIQNPSFLQLGQFLLRALLSLCHLMKHSGKGDSSSWLIFTWFERYKWCQLPTVSRKNMTSDKCLIALL